MQLKEVKATKVGKCSKCGRDIKKGWSIYFDTDSKRIFCKPCGSGNLERAQVGIQEAPENIKDLAIEDDKLFKLNYIIGKINEFEVKLSFIKAELEKIENIWGAFMALMSEPDSHEKAKKKITGKTTKK